MIRWWKQWHKRRREEPVAQKAMELREFVYLDDVSVTSLLSSRLVSVSCLASSLTLWQTQVRQRLTQTPKPTQHRSSSRASVLVMKQAGQRALKYKARRQSKHHSKDYTR